MCQSTGKHGQSGYCKASPCRGSLIFPEDGSLGIRPCLGMPCNAHRENTDVELIATKPAKKNALIRLFQKLNFKPMYAMFSCGLTQNDKYFSTTDPPLVTIHNTVDSL